MRIILFLIVLIGTSISVEFVTEDIIKKVKQKYGMFAENRFTSLQELILELQNKNQMEILEKVNDFFNKVSYTTDKDNYGVTDYWATPFEFLARDEGDCEDYAIAKYFLLKHLGIPSNKMYITYVGVVGYEQAHMVLTFFDTPSSDPFILDSFNEDLLLASQRKDLKPIYYFNPDVLIDGNKTNAHRKWDQLIKNIMENKI